MKGRIGFGGKRGLVWVLLASWLVPLMMTGAYIVLIATSEVDATGAAWEGIAFAFVLVLWFLFRILTQHAAMARAVDIGAADEVIELADFQLQRHRSARSRMPFHVYRALAFDILEDWPAALAELDKTQPAGTWRPLALTVKVSALAATGKPEQARTLFDAELAGRPVTRVMQVDILTLLADARVKLAEGETAAAEKVLARLADDIRAGSGIRARAKKMIDALLARSAR
jgi:hypothetical protein